MRSLISKALADEDSDIDEAEAWANADVPDHLPGSPLCPLDAKHKSGGRGICPLHGTRKAMVLASAQKRKSRVGGVVGGQRGSLTGAKREPAIVFDSGDGGGRF